MEGIEKVVRGAGGLVCRRDPTGGLEVVLVHRPAYDDWEFPKGKLEQGEAEPDAALREVEEETGLRCRLGREVGTSSYRDARGRPKIVRYWEMHPVAGALAPANEVDAARWVPLAELRAALTHDRDRIVLDQFERLLRARTSPRRTSPLQGDVPAAAPVQHRRGRRTAAAARAGVTGMGVTGPEVLGRATVAQRWLARGALAAAGASVLVPLLAVGFKASVALVLVGMVGLGLTAAGIWWALTHRGLVRALAIAVAVAAPVTILVMYTRARLTWVVLLAFALLGVAVAAGRAALRRDPGPGKMREYEAPPAKRPFVIMNPRSGGGKVVQFGLKEKAEALGAEVVLLAGPDVVDVGALARKAVADGADLLGVAGGDGTQALVAGIAAEHDVPLLVISAGTRNHFALDLGLDREDPSRCLDALTDGVELRVDLGFIGERPFVNNASFGAYAAVVQSPAYRDDKARTTADMLPELLVGQQGPRLVAKAGNVTVDGPQAVLVSNNVYGMGDIAGLGRRARLDRGTLGMFGVTVGSAVQAAGLLRGVHARGLTMLAAREVVVDADAAQIPVGVDGEALLLDTPVRCTVRPVALRVRVPRDRPGVPEPKPVIDWKRLWRMALTLPGPGGAATRSG